MTTPRRAYTVPRVLYFKSYMKLRQTPKIIGICESGKKNDYQGSKKIRMVNLPQ